MIAKAMRDSTCCENVRYLRTLWIFLRKSPIGLQGGRLRVFDVGSVSKCYEVSAHSIPEKGGCNGRGYLDLLPHRLYLRWGKLVAESRGGVGEGGALGIGANISTVSQITPHGVGRRLRNRTQSVL